jgi:hypothetical protein
MSKRLKQAKSEVRRLRGLLNSGKLRQNEILAKQELLRQWELELKRLGG